MRYLQLIMPLCKYKKEVTLKIQSNFNVMDMSGKDISQIIKLQLGYSGPSGVMRIKLATDL